MNPVFRNDEHRIALEELFQMLDSSSAGLSSEDAIRRQREFGPNALEEKKRASIIFRFGRHLVNFFALLLWTGTALAFVSEYYSPDAGNLYIGIALALVVILNAAFTFMQEYQSEKMMESFSRMMPVRIEVMRDGARMELLSREIVPGDVLYLKEGDRVPADGRLIEVNSMKVDHSALTGESEPQLRKLECTHENILESRNMVFSGTLVQSGNGAAVVYGTGMNTQLGRIADMTKRTEEVPSPLRKELNHFIRVISAIAIMLGITFFAVGVMSGKVLMVSLIFAIGIIVANVPEGLLPTVTLSLSIASRKMAGRKALIKSLDSVETLGSTTVICTDKTGTITENRMSVNTIFMNMDMRNVHEKDLSSMPGMDVLLRISVLCNNARLGGGGRYVGDPTEGALVLFAGERVDVAVLNAENPRLRESPFDSRTMRMITVNRHDAGSAVHMKGAPEVVLAKCGGALVNGTVLPLDERRTAEILKYYERLASRGERVLGLAYKEADDGRMEDGFIFAALVGMLDPPRKEIPGAVAKCRTAGIKVIMVTGDHSLTAEAIARIAGLMDRGRANVMTGQELDLTDDEGLKGFLNKSNLIFARTSPIQKLRIVRTLQSMGEVVTVTGDGVNDAPALKNADMGVAMGVAGTEVAKEASDMVLLDDNFATIVNAVEEGRNVYGNIKKFIAYILTSNVPEILPFIAFVLLGIPLPLGIVLILLIDLGTDLLPALGLGAETPEHDVMKRPPRLRNERLLSPALLFVSYGIVGMVQAAAGFFSYFVVLYEGGWSWGAGLAPADPVYQRAVTAFFASIVVCQVANVMICRTRRESVFVKGLLSNRLVLAGIVFELFLLALIVYHPLANRFLGTRALALHEISLSVPFAALILLLDETRKLLLRRGNRFIEMHLSW